VKTVSKTTVSLEKLRLSFDKSPCFLQELVRLPVRKRVNRVKMNRIDCDLSISANITKANDDYFV
jgi:hypothetical protein